MFKRLLRGLSNIFKSLFGSPRIPEPEPPDLEAEFTTRDTRPLIEPDDGPEPEFFDTGQDYQESEFVEVVARAKYSSKKGKVGAEVHFFLERDNTYTASELQAIFQTWVATGKHPKDVGMQIIDWTASTTDDRGRETTNSSDQYPEDPEHSLNKGLRAALRRAHIDF